MFDFLVALAVGFIGLFVVYTLFLSISVSDNAPTIKTPKTKKSDGKKAATGGAATKKAAGDAKSKKEQREEDAIIEAELRIANSGLQSDSKKAEALTLDEVKERQRAKTTKQADASGSRAANFTQRQLAAEKEAGFQVVQTPKEAAAAKPSKSASPTADGREQLSRKEQLDKKLNNFFRNNARKGKRRDDDDGVQASKIIVKRDIGAVKESAWKSRAAAAAANENEE